jgi:hypothetical protein
MFGKGVDLIRHLKPMTLMPNMRRCGRLLREVGISSRRLRGPASAVVKDGVQAKLPNHCGEGSSKGLW